MAGAHPSGSFSVSTVTHYSYGHQRQHGEEAEALPDLRLDQIKISLLQGKSNCIVGFSRNEKMHLSQQYFRTFQNLSSIMTNFKLYLNSIDIINTV